MALLNIGASNRDDAFYRYKMPKMNKKIEGRGNGIKTNIVNMVEIAKALARPASYITKFFGCELGAQSKFDDKTGTSLVNGSHGTAKLAGLLEIFINKYVQCYGCRNPETEILITKTQMIELKCAACGFISTVDMRDKLTTFILKNPPEAKKGAKDKKALRRAEKERLKEGEVADEEKKKPKKEIKKISSKKKSGGTDEDNNGSVPIMDSDDDIQWQTDTSLEAARRQIQEQLNSVTADMVMLSTEEPKLVNKAKGLIQKGVEPNELLSSLLLIGSPQEAITALYEAIFYDTNKGYAKEAVKKKKYLAAAAVAQGDEGGSQMLLLRAMEDFCQKENAVAIKEVGLVLKALYDEDILEEKYIVKWYEETEEKSLIWKNVKPFIEWLQNAESETEEE